MDSENIDIVGRDKGLDGKERRYSASVDID
jgi:hypothetical protein